jgi:hypothetical protein
MARTGFAAIFLVMLAVVLLFIWAGSQHFITSSVRRRVRIAETERAAVLETLSNADQMVAMLPVLVRMGFGLPGPSNKDTSGDDVRVLSQKVSESFSHWSPGEELRIPVSLPWTSSEIQHVPLSVQSSVLIAHLLTVKGPKSPFDPTKHCPKLKCNKTSRSTRKGPKRKGWDPERTVFNYRKGIPPPAPIRLTGIGQFRTQTRADGLGISLLVTASLMRQISMTVASCPDCNGLYRILSFQVHPVEIGRTFKIQRKSR